MVVLPTVSELDLRKDSGRKFCCPTSGLSQSSLCQICLEEPSRRNTLKTKKRDLGIKQENIKRISKFKSMFPKQRSKTNT